MNSLIKEYYEPFLKGKEPGLIINKKLVPLSNLEIDEDIMTEIFTLDPYEGPIIISEEGVDQISNAQTSNYKKVCEILKVMRNDDKINGSIKDFMETNNTSKLIYKLDSDLLLGSGHNKKDTFNDFAIIHFKIGQIEIIGHLILKHSLEFLIKTEVDNDFKSMINIRSFNFKFQSMGETYEKPVILAIYNENSLTNKYTYTVFDINNIPEEYNDYYLKEFIEYEENMLNVCIMYHYINAFFGKEDVFQYSYVMKKATLQVEPIPKDYKCSSCMRKIKKVYGSKKDHLLKNEILEEYYLSSLTDEKIKQDLSKVFECNPCQLYFINKNIDLIKE